jgi:RNA polymerase sigma-70 factor (ECF subfamily)
MTFVRSTRSSAVALEPFEPRAATTFRDVVEPHVTRLVAIARRILGSTDLAWDAVQEALVSLWNQGALPADPARWLVRAVVHRSLHASRTQRRRRRHERCACCDRPEAAHVLDPAAILDRREIATRVDRALRALPREQREVLVLRLVDGLDYDSIARKLAIPIGTVRSRINRGRAALCRVLDCGEAVETLESAGTR